MTYNWIIETTGRMGMWMMIAYTEGVFLVSQGITNKELGSIGIISALWFLSPMIKELEEEVNKKRAN